MNPDISIIVPVYNVEKHLSRCLDSLLVQTLREIEIILVDDGSRDRSGIICDNYAERDTRIVVIHRRNAGPAAARNAGIAAARGHYLGFVDSDDYVQPAMYERLLAAATKWDAQLVLCNYQVIQGGQICKIAHQFASGQLLDAGYVSSHVMPAFAVGDGSLSALWNKIYRKDFFHGTGLRLDESLSYAEDWWLNIQLFARITRFCCIDEALYCYDTGNGGLSYRHYRRDFGALLIEQHEKLLSILRHYPISDDSYRGLYQYFSARMLAQIARILEHEKEQEHRRRRIIGLLNDERVVQACAAAWPVLPGRVGLVARAIARRCPGLAYALLAYPYSPFARVCSLLPRAGRKCARLFRGQ